MGGEVASSGGSAFSLKGMGGPLPLHEAARNEEPHDTVFLMLTIHSALPPIRWPTPPMRALASCTPPVGP